MKFPIVVLLCFFLSCTTTSAYQYYALELNDWSSAAGYLEGPYPDEDEELPLSDCEPSAEGRECVVMKWPTYEAMRLKIIELEERLIGCEE